MLARQAWVLGRNAGARGAVAARAGGYLAISNAAFVDAFAQGNQLFVFGKAGFGCLSSGPEGNVAHVFVAQSAGKALHNRIFALARLELLQLLEQILGVLARQLWILRRSGVTISAVAGHAHGGILLRAFDQIRFDHLGRFRLGSGGLGGLIGKSGGSQTGSKQKTGDEFHGESGDLRISGIQNLLILQCFMREIPSRPLLRPCGVLKMSSTPSKKSNNPGPRSKARTTVAQAQQGKASALTRTAPTYAKPAVATEPAKEAMAWLHTTRFLTTAAQLHHLPALDVPEFAFVGRSNAGKSTCINMLAQQKQLAYASKTPGRTQHINLFSIGRQGATDAVLADLPGYGYAAVAKDSKLRWQRVMANYLKSRENLAAVVLLCDPRLGLTELDDILLDVIRPRVEKGLKFVILLTKADKLNKTEAAKALSIAKLQAGGGEVRMFSALNRLGVDQMALQLRAWAAEPLVRSVDAPLAVDGADVEGEMDASLEGVGGAQDDETQSQ